MSLLPMSMYGGLDPFPKYLGGNDVLVRVSSQVSSQIDNRILHTYLPGIFRNAIRHGYAATYDLRPFFHRCNAVIEGLVTHRSLKRTFTMLLHSLAQNVGSSEGPSVDLVEMLEAAYANDQQYPQRTSHYFHRTYSRWVCLSEIAMCFHSRRIRSVLCQFFIKHGRHIANVEHPHALLFWAYALINSDLHETDTISCLREILMGRPMFLEEAGHYAIRDGSLAALQVFENLREIMTRMDTQSYDMFERGRGFLRRRALARRHSHSPLRMNYGLSRRVRMPFGALKSHQYPKGIMGRYSSKPLKSTLIRKQENHERRLRQLELKMNALQSMVEDEGYLGDTSLVSVGYLSDDGTYNDHEFSDDDIFTDMEFEPDFMDVSSRFIS